MEHRRASEMRLEAPTTVGGTSLIGGGVQLQRRPAVFLGGRTVNCIRAAIRRVAITLL